MRRASSIRSVGTRLSAALVVVVAGVLGLIWLALVPTLQRRLVDGKERQLLDAAQTLEIQAGPAKVNQDFVDRAARATDTRVVYFVPAGPSIRALYASSHLSRAAAVEVARDPFVLRAAALRTLDHGRLTRDGEDYVEVAISDPYGRVLLFSSSLLDTLNNVQLVRSRLQFAGFLALALVVPVGWAGALLFTRRIRRLERAAERIAAGDFTQPVVDRRSDELGQLAAAFDRMRLQLAQLDGARRDFIANASHELRTPIFSLGGFLELLREEELDEETRAEFLGTMADQVRRLAKLATDLLDLSRLDAGQLRPLKERVPLGELARDLSEEFVAIARRDGHRFEVIIAADGVAVADRERVLQVGRALIENALLHTATGSSIRLVVDGTTIAVEDDGPGIPAEAHELVFARFTRIEGSRSSGTGLGLAIARELVKRMDGELVLESSPGRTVFRVTLPAAPAGRAAAASPSAA